MELFLIFRHSLRVVFKEFAAIITTMEKLGNTSATEAQFEGTNETHPAPDVPRGVLIGMRALQEQTQINVPPPPRETAFEGLVAAEQTITRRSSVVGTGEAKRSDFDADWD